MNKYIISDTFDPHFNLALEEHLIDSVQPDECILYLWQNRKTVVIGRNQNAYTECKFEKLRGGGGHLVRRLSGGGAVFHDDGNLNFSFIARKGVYSVEKQLSVIIKALKQFGIPAEKSGRNDIEVNQRKFSGNAYFEKNGKHCHHGTLMVNVDLEHLGDYLNVSADKLAGKGIASVRSRIVNLNELSPDITIEHLKSALITAFGEIYGNCEEIREKINTEIEKLRKKFASDDWTFGKIKNFDLQISDRFSWGGAEICLSVDHATITDAKIYTDALETAVFDEMASSLIGTDYSYTEIEKKLCKIKIETPTSATPYLHDILSLIREKLFY